MNAGKNIFVGPKMYKKLLTLCHTDGTANDYIRLRQLDGQSEDVSRKQYAEFVPDPNAPSVQLHGDIYAILMDAGIDITNVPSNELIELCDYITFTDYLAGKNFNSQAEIKDFCIDIFDKIVTDKTLNDKKRRDAGNPRLANHWTMFHSLLHSPSKPIDWAETTAVEMWNTHFMPEYLSQNLQRMKSENPLKPKKDIVALLQAIYGFTDADMYGFEYFFAQCLCDKMPAAKNKVLFLSGAQYTGKSTVADIIACILNGEKNTENRGRYQSDIGTEMQINQFDIPVAVGTRCTVMDEAFYADMSKTYDNFKKMITMDSARIRFKFRNGVRVMSAHRNYVITTNRGISDIVIDDSERRFLAITFSQKPVKCDMRELWGMWREFILHCRKDVAEIEQMYNDNIDATLVRGRDNMDKDDFIAALDSVAFARCIEHSPEYQLTAPKLAEFCGFSPNTRYNKRIFRLACEECYGKPDDHARWQRHDIQRLLHADVAAATTTEQPPF
jgi:hypothetical protein